MNEITTQEEATAFVKGKNDAELAEYLRSNANKRQQAILTNEDYEQVARCIKSMTAQLFGLYPCGSFGKAVLINDFTHVVAVADDTNILCLNLYMFFLHNCVPASLVRKAKENLGKGLAS